MCDILTSTATGSFHERFSVIEVNEQNQEICPEEIYKCLELDSAIILPNRTLTPRGSCSLHLHVAQQEPLFDTSLQHPGTEATSCNPVATEKEQGWTETAVH